MNPIPFTKMHSCGNDLIIIDNRNTILAGVNLQDLAKKICARKTGAGSDGLLILEPDPRYHFFMRFLNPDGTEAFCGNGSLCSAFYAHKQKIAPSEVQFRSPFGIHVARVADDTVAMEMPNPRDWKLNLKIDDDTGHFINTGAPHTVVFMEGMNQANIKSIGRHIRYHSLFAPAGTNVNLVQIVSDSKIIVRTYERGVEDETLACGSGAVAAAAISFLVKNLKPPITCSFKGGDLLIDFKFENGAFKDVFLKSKVVSVFEGKFSY